jgi:hypothetical protein
MEGLLAPEVSAFLRDHIESHEELEILLLIHRQLDREWTVAAVATELGMAPALATEAAESLRRKNLLSATGTEPGVSFTASQQSSETTDSLRRLIEAYQQHRFEIVALLGTHAIDRLRTRALKTFSDSFVIGRKKDQNG